MSVAINRAFLLKNRTTPTETVDTGEAYFWLEGTSVKYKDDTQAVKTLATGVTPEDVQDIIGAFITSGNNKITAVYNDAGNSFVITLVESNIVHQNISGSGTNTHAQIDSHISSVSNPHSTTASQVGAYTTGQTDTLLLTKYDASNPNGYETPAQLNARDIANRARANHTGTQLASTISDFASGVLSSILTGFSVGSNVAIVAADSVLGAFGKVQGQINAINLFLTSLVLGDQFENFEDVTTFTTTSNVNQVAATFTTGSKQAGKYRIGISYDWTYSVTSADAIFSLFVDGVLVGGEWRMESSEVSTQRVPFSWFKYVSFGTVSTHTIELRARCETSGNTLTVYSVQAEIWRASV